MTDASLHPGQHRIRPSRLPGGEPRRVLLELGSRVPAGIPRFLLAGGSLSATSWLTRFPLSTVMPFWLAVGVSYAVGMALGFELYRRWVFPGSTLPVGSQILRFIGVNLAGMTTVIGGAAALVVMLRPTMLPPAVSEGLAHGTAIIAGAIVNYLGHRAISFARERIGAPFP